MWSAIVANRICSESADCLGSATVVGTWGDTVLEVRVLLSLMLKMLERTLANRAYQPTRMILFLARTETVESTSSTVEDGGRERLWSGCEPKPASADQIHSTQGTQGPHCARGSRSPELSTQNTRADYCKSCISAHTDDSISRTGRKG